MRDGKPSPSSSSSAPATSFQNLFTVTNGLDAIFRAGGEIPPAQEEDVPATTSNLKKRTRGGDDVDAQLQPLKEIVFKPSEFAYDYSKETIPTSDAGEKIRELLRRRVVAPVVSSSPDGVIVKPEDGDEDDDAAGDDMRPSKRAKVEDFLKIPVKKIQSAKKSVERDDVVSTTRVVKGEEDDDHEEDLAHPREKPALPVTFSVPASGRRVTSGLIQLHNEIVTFRDVVSPTKAERTERERVAKVVESLATELWPDSRTTMFGSASTNLSLPDSDVDIVIHGGGGKRAIYEISRAFRSRRMVEYMEVIDRARVPIVNLKFKGARYSADICFDEDGGPRTSRLINGVMESLPEVRPLVLVVKRFLAERELNDTFRGGMGSFLCFLTVVASVQRSRRLATPPDAPLSLGFLLLQYFDLFGNVLNYHEAGISLLEGGSFFSKRKRGWFSLERPFLLSIENPEKPVLDVGKNSWAIDNVRRAFSHAHRSLLSAVTDFDAKQHQQLQHQGIGSRSNSANGGGATPSAPMTSIILDSIFPVDDVLLNRF